MKILFETCRVGHTPSDLVAPTLQMQTQWNGRDYGGTPLNVVSVGTHDKLERLFVFAARLYIRRLPAIVPSRCVYHFAEAATD